MPLFDGDFKPGQVNFPQGALVHDGVRSHTPRFLAVDGKVLRAGGYALGLDAANISRRQLAREIRVLGEIFKAAAAEGAALGVQARPQQNGDLLRGGLLAHGPADFLAQRRIPAARHGGGCGEAGGRHAGVQPQVIRRPGLLAHAVGAVGQGDGRHARVFVAPRREHGITGQQSTFLFKV